MPRQRRTGPSLVETVSWSNVVSTMPLPPPNDQRATLLQTYADVMNLYIQSLPSSSNMGTYNGDTLQRLETELVDIMSRLGMFDDIINIFPLQTRLQINTNYDYHNLTHRFIILHFASCGFWIEGLMDILYPYPMGNMIRAIPSSMGRIDPHVVTTFILSCEDSGRPTVASTAEDIDNRGRNRINSANMEFVINGQKTKLSLTAELNPSSRSRYIGSIRLRIGSLRNSNIRNACELINTERNLVFRRIPFTRPVHGFKFVRSESGSRLLVKEIH